MLPVTRPAAFRIWKKREKSKHTDVSSEPDDGLIWLVNLVYANLRLSAY